MSETEQSKAISMRVRHAHRSLPQEPDNHVTAKKTGDPQGAPFFLLFQ